MRFAIIGSAGRNGLISKVTLKTYERLVETSKSYLESFSSNNSIRIEDLTVVSGGAALSDHLAVTLYLKGIISKLHLHLPCEFDFQQHRFYSRSGSSSGQKVAAMANSYHEQFSKQIGINSLYELSIVLTGTQKQPNQVATYDISGGFKARNNKIARSDCLLAFTFDSGSAQIYLPNGDPPEGAQPKSGGTKMTWDLARNIIRVWEPIIKV